MTTHEQTARNAEIVQRRLDGETTGVLAREYDVTPTRTCAGCKEIRLITNPFGGRRVLRCALGEEIGQRCSNYEERTAP